jgi:hypothetical protein
VTGPLRCGSTASAPTSHYVTAETFGHVCERGHGHAQPHRCRCSHTWRDRQPRWQNTTLDTKAQRKALRIATQARRVARAYRTWERTGLQVNSAVFANLHREQVELRRLIRSSEDGPL